MLWFAFVCFLTCLDILTTSWGIGTGQAVESNPLALLLIQTIGLTGFAVLKVLVAILVGLGFVFIAKHSRRVAAIGRGTITAILIWPVANNLQVLA